MSVLSAPWPALVPKFVLFATAAGTCSCTCVVCTLACPVLVPRLLVTPAYTWAALVLLVPLLAPLLEFVLWLLLFVLFLVLVLLARLSGPVSTFLLSVRLPVVVLVCWPAGTCALLLLLLILLAPTHLYLPCHPNLPPGRWLLWRLPPHPHPLNPSRYHKGHG